MHIVTTMSMGRRLCGFVWLILMSRGIARQASTHLNGSHRELLRLHRAECRAAATQTTDSDNTTRKVVRATRWPQSPVCCPVQAASFVYTPDSPDRERNARGSNVALWHGSSPLTATIIHNELQRKLVGQGRTVIFPFSRCITVVPQVRMPYAVSELSEQHACEIAACTRAAFANAPELMHGQLAD